MIPQPIKCATQNTTGDHMVSWGRAFKGAAGIVGFAIIWWIVGGIFIAAGILISGFRLSFSAGISINMLIGGLLILTGYIVGILGTLAAFLKVLPEIVAEELQK